MNTTVLSNIQQLGDLELAVLLCLVADQHCIVKTDTGSMERVGQEIAQVINMSFPIRYSRLL